MKKAWTIWRFALGSYSDEKTEPYDHYVAIIRTFWVTVHMITCYMIIAGNAKVLGWFQIMEEQAILENHYKRCIEYMCINNYSIAYALKYIKNVKINIPA